MKNASSGSVAPRGALAQRHGRAERDQRRRACRRSASRWRCCRRWCPWRAPASRRCAASIRTRCGNSRVEHRLEVVVADAGADGHAVGRDLDPPQLLEVRDEDRRRDVAHELGDPEPDVGRARRRWSPPASPRAPSARSSTVGGTITRSLAGPDVDPRAVVERREPRQHPRALGDQRVGLGRGLRRGLGGRDDRLVAGAAAEVALQRLLDLALARPAGLRIQSA